MWGEVDDVKGFLSKAINFTGDHVLYGNYMRRVIAGWPISCENALTDPHINQKAWIGHAACALAIQCPENITRRAWKELTGEQQYLANQEAIRAIQSWKDDYIKDRELHKGMGESLLF